MAAAPATLASFKEELSRLVAHFSSQQPYFTGPDYNEAKLREDFLNPFFAALGWDVGNRKGLIHTEREVDIEVRTEISGKQKRADYVFRIARLERFTCEAKKPAESLHGGHAYQAKRDAYARSIPFAILSDFEETRIYVVGARPHRSESVTVGQWKHLHFTQYLDSAAELWDLLAYENVQSGSLDRLIDGLPKRATRLKSRQGYLIKPDRTRSLDAEFLNFLDDARQKLGSDLLKHNDREELLSGNHLNEAAQRILDRLVFLRICEDRGIDTGTLLSTQLRDWYHHQDERPRLKRGAFDARKTSLFPETVDDEPPSPRYAPPAEGGLYRVFVAHVRALDQRPPSYQPFFNGQLFKPHFSEDLVVGDEWLANFIDDLTADDEGYNFADIKVEILGDAYERFLGKVLRPQGRGATIEEKPEVRKAGGVYYTPRYIVDYIVEQTVGRQLEAKAPAQVAKLRFLDPACGSGSFLIRVYERVMEHHLRHFTERVREFRERSALDGTPLDKLLRPFREDYYLDAAGNVRLTTRLKRQILQNNVYGVDIDAQAVEVTQLSLYLKMLEGENRESLHHQAKDLFNKEALLPPLDQNIKCGNSLIGSDFSLDPAELVRVNAFDWDIGFEKIMDKGGFDAVVGNPPYIRIQTMQESDPNSVKYLNTKYSTAAKGNYDIYVVFVERMLGTINRTGQIGFILPHKFFNAQYGQLLRQHIAKGKHVNAIVHFGDKQVFSDATTYTCLLFLSKEPNEEFSFVSVKELREWQTGNGCSKAILTSAKLACSEWAFSASESSSIFEKISLNNSNLSSIADRIFQGLVTGSDPVFILENRDGSRFYSSALEREVELEPSLLHSLCKGSVNIRRYEIEGITKSIFFPYNLLGDKAILISTDEFAQKYPKCWQYLLDNRKTLESRERGKWKHDKWYAFGRSQNLAEMEQEKILTPSIAKRASFTHDSNDFFYFVGSGGGGGGGYGITLKPEAKENYRYLLGLLNSKLLDSILKSVSSPFANGYYAYNRQYIEQLPIRRIDFSNSLDHALHDRLVSLVDKMLSLMPLTRLAKSDAERTALENAIRKTDRDIDQLVYQLYGLTPEEIALVEGTAETAEVATEA